MSHNELIARIAEDVGVLAKSGRLIPVWGTSSAAFNAKMEEFAKAVAEECAKIVEGEMEDASPRLARAIREAFTPAPDGAPPPTSPPAAGSSR